MDIDRDELIHSSLQNSRKKGTGKKTGRETGQGNSFKVRNAFTDSSDDSRIELYYREL